MKPQEKRKHVRDKEEKIQSILHTTTQLIENEGYDNISTNQIAAHANISVGTIYRYFPEGKPSIIKKLAESELNNIISIDDLITISGKSIEEILRVLIVKYIENHIEKRAFYLAFEKAYLSSQDLFKNFNDSIEDLLQQLLPYIKKLKEPKNELKNSFENLTDSAIIEKLGTIFRIIDAIIHRHILIEKITLDQTELVEIILKIIFALL